MNVLAEQQKLLFESGITDEERLRRNNAFLEHYYVLRKKDENSILGRLSLKARKRLHWMVLLVYIIKNKLGGFSYEIIADKHSSTDRPIIYAVTHVGKCCSD